MIKPTIGRVVLVYANKKQLEEGQAWPALVNYVHSDTMINCAGFNGYGTTLSYNSCPLIQEGAEIPTTGFFATWMPYQMAQAKIAEATHSAAN